MSDQPTPDPSADPDDIAAIFEEMVHVGAHLARNLRDLPPLLGQDLAQDFHTITRAMRQCALVAQKLREQPAPAPRQAAPSPPSRAAAREKIARAVQDAIDTHAADRAEALHVELLERLESAELAEDLGNRPIAEIIQEICRDLHAVARCEAKQFRRRTPDDVRDLRAVARAEPGTIDQAIETLAHLTDHLANPHRHEAFTRTHE